MYDKQANIDTNFIKPSKHLAKETIIGANLNFTHTSYNLHSTKQTFIETIFIKQNKTLLKPTTYIVCLDSSWTRASQRCQLILIDVASTDTSLGSTLSSIK
jgi:hypothetical protein